MSFAEKLAKFADLGIRDHEGPLLGSGENHIVNRRARGGGNSDCRWEGILIVADQLQSKMVKGAILKVYKGAPHGLCTTLKDQVNEDLLAFLKA
jgi:hypothetical protein